MISTRTRSAVEALRLGLYRMLVKRAAVLLAAACTHLPTERKRLLARRGKQTHVGGGSLFYSRTKVLCVFFRFAIYKDAKRIAPKVQVQS